MNQNYKLPLTEGSFTFGANYWASHAGTNMWREWDEKVIREDLSKLSGAGIRLLRIFPLWPDFQPIKKLYGSRSEVRYESEEILPFTPEGRAGVDPIMIGRMERFCNIAEEYGIQLIIALITGWMSGRRYVPRMFETVDVLTDPCALKWEIRFVQYMVRHFLNEPSIVAWELGNECNTLGTENSDQAYLWVKTLTMAVKEIDSKRPMLAGMHGLAPEGRFSPQMMGEIDDLLTTHPYPLFTPYCNTNPMTGMKSALHATAESVWYAGLSGKPCFVEEAGALGPMMASNENVAHYIKSSAMTAWAHGLRAYLWWCANEQMNLMHAPYDWCDVERELGLFDENQNPKPVLKAITKLQRYVDDFPYELTDPIVDAVCILTQGQDQWAVSYGAFLLAKQAGLDIQFCYCDDEIPEADVYMIPSAAGLTSIARHTMEVILSRVEKGAGLYISNYNAILSSFERMTGLRSNYRMEQVHTDSVLLPTLHGHECKLELSAPICMNLSVVSAEVAARTDTNQPALTKNQYGKGVIWYCNYPIEYEAGTTPLAEKKQWYKLYEAMGFRNKKKIAEKSDMLAGLTEHIVSENKRVLIIMNYEPKEKEVSVYLEADWKIEAFLPLEDSAVIENEENEIRLQMPQNSGVSVIVCKVK